VGSDEIAAGAVGSAEIATDAVDTDEIAAGAVGTAEILDATIQVGDVNQSVWSGSVHQAGTLAARPAAGADNNGFLYFATDVSGGTLYRSDGTTWGRVAPGNIVTNSDLADNSVDSSKIVNGSIVTEDLADNAVTSAKVAPDTLTAADIATDAVTAAEIATGAVGGSEIADGSLRASDIGVLNGTVTIDAPSIGSQSCITAQSLANSVPGIQVNDLVILNAPATMDDALSPSAVVQPAADRLTIRLCNVKGGSVDEPPRTWGYIITR
jgi:hypothetical protein